MSTDSHILEELKAFRAKDKFSASAWDKRGLIPSDAEMCSRLNDLFNRCADDLIEATEQSPSSRQYRKILKASLSSVNRYQYDTEEREFVCDYYLQLAEMVKVDLKDDLNRWLYGTLSTTFFKVFSFFKGKDKVIETISRDCTNCGAKLDTFVLQRGDGIPDSGWDVVKCNTCGEYNLLNHGPDVKRLRFGQYKWIEHLRRDEYTEEQARTRMKQIKYFRKSD